MKPRLDLLQQGVDLLRKYIKDDDFDMGIIFGHRLHSCHTVGCFVGHCMHWLPDWKKAVGYVEPSDTAYGKMIWSNEARERASELRVDLDAARTKAVAVLLGMPEKVVARMFFMDCECDREEDCEWCKRWDSEDPITRLEVADYVQTYIDEQQALGNQ